jgi:hypothetical protein
MAWVDDAAAAAAAKVSSTLGDQAGLTEEELKQALRDAISESVPSAEETSVVEVW